MAVQYNKLFHILVDKKMTNSHLAEKAGDCKVDDVLEFNRNEG